MKVNILDILDDILYNLEKIKKIDKDFGIDAQNVFADSIFECLHSNNESIKTIYKKLKKLKNL